jgi:hypothetical protein
MSTQQLDRLRPAGSPARIGQGTAVEQSRAVAEVQAQVIVAQQFPRSMQAAVRAMEEACAQPALAGRALFRFPRGKNEDGTPNILSGPSVHIARELARCFGNLQYGITEMVRDDDHGQSEMMAWAWDMESNTRSSTTFIVPHKRDTKWGAKDLTDLRDIYENNANNGGRRVREMIFAVLPGWYVTRALELCAQTNEKGGGKPLPERIATAVRLFEQYRVSPARIAAKWGYRSVDELTATDVAALAVIYSSLQQGTVTVTDEFPEEAGAPVGMSDLAPPQNVPPAGEQPSPPAASSEPPADPAGGTRPPQRASTGQVGMIRKAFERLTSVKPDDETPEQRKERLRQTSRLARIPYPGIASTSELTSEQARDVRETLARCKAIADVEALLDSGALADEPREDGEPGE